MFKKRCSLKMSSKNHNRVLKEFLKRYKFEGNLSKEDIQTNYDLCKKYIEDNKLDEITFLRCAEIHIRQSGLDFNVTDLDSIQKYQYNILNQFSCDEISFNDFICLNIYLFKRYLDHVNDKEIKNYTGGSNDY